MCGIRQVVHVQLPVEEGNGKPSPLIHTSQVYDGTSEMTTPSRTCLMAENSSSSSSRKLLSWDIGQPFLCECVQATYIFRHSVCPRFCKKFLLVFPLLSF